MPGLQTAGKYFLLYRGGLRSLWRIPAAGGTPRRVEGVGHFFLAPAIALKGDRLAYTFEVLKVNLWKVRLTDLTMPPARLN